MKRHIPNLITLINLLCGCFAILFAIEGNGFAAGLFIVGGAVADFLDGTAARLLNVKSSIGKELDSLADIVTFGVAPGMIAFGLLRYYTEPHIQYLEYIAFLIPMFSALRLAKFNVDERQTENFVGMPTPANALFWAALPWAIIEFGFPVLHTFMIVAAICLLSLLLVSEIPMFSFKIKNFTWKDNTHKYIFLLTAIALLALLRTAAIPVLVLLYPIFSLVFRSKINL